MIDFRYHLVSIVAIFLALALGIILGSTTLSQSVADGLRNQANDAKERGDRLRAENTQLSRQIKGDGQFAQALGPQTVAERLRGQSVVFVETPGAASDAIEQLSDLVQKAGASVTGRVTLQTKFLDDNQQTQVEELSNQLKPEGVTFAAEADAYDKAGAVLASAIVTKDAAKAGREDTSGGAILNGFKQLGYVTTSGKPGQHATLAVVMAPSTPYTGTGGETDNQALLSLTTALDAADRGTALGGPNTAAQKGGGLIAALRGSDAEKNVSSVDVTDQPSGRVVMILALQEELAGKAGQYGVGPDASGYLPSPAPVAGKSG
ncbi:copper transporter [Actinomadura rudentiformis]|uniref:Copper transporter n=1 Tax=Actinomadura rudentiformis TaxID=359158 RepID=A0A6H9YH50_9ACTN|nr:copper transporter [Actinomadura rudentiformis]KAB2339949.1 copper transporter [Actinomadura rudentiformis]